MMRPFCRTHTTLNRAALVIPRTKGEKEKPKKRLILTTAKTKMQSPQQSQSGRIKGTSLAYPSPKTSPITCRRMQMLPRLTAELWVQRMLAVGKN